MNHLRIFGGLIFALGLSLISCNEDELEGRPYPSVDIIGITDIDGNGAIANAEILSVGNNGISDYGFVYDDAEIPTIERCDWVSLGSSPEKGVFSGIVDRNMVKDRKYKVRAYAISKGSNLIVYSQTAEFFSLGSVKPEIKNFYPKQGMAGDTITVTGSGFSNVPRNNIVKFGLIFSDAFKASKDTLLCTVPKTTSAGPNELSVTVSNQVALAEEEFVMN